MKKPVRIVIFAKAPLPGFAKTRLIPALGAQGAADLARRFLAHTLDAALAAQVGAVELCVGPAPADSVWQTFELSHPVQWTDQGEGDLGERMARAARRTLDAGESVLLIGTDCPELDAAQLRRAADALQRSEATLLSTHDGGYVLLGLNRFHPSLFSGIAWSTDSVAAETLSRMKALGWRVASHPTVHDIDEPSDLKWLPKSWPQAEPGAPRIPDAGDPHMLPSAITTPDSHGFPWYVRLFFWNQKRRYGAVLEPARLWGRTPRVFTALALLYGALDRRSSPIAPALRTLITVRVSQINWCSFCVDVNAATALKRGIGEEKLLAISTFRDSALFSAQEKSALAYAEAMTHTERQPSADEWAGLRQHFSDDAIIELTALIAFQNLSSKFNATLQVPPQGFCAVMPLPTPHDQSDT